MSDSSSPLAALARARSAVRRRVLVHRRLIAAVLVGVAALLALHVVQRPPEPTIAVWTAGRDLASGTVLRAGDVRRVAFAAGTVPAGAVTDPRPLYGRYVAAPLRRGAPLTDLAVVAPALTRADPERTAVPVRIADAGLVSLLRVGDRVDLVAVDPERARRPEVVASGARVLALPVTPADRDAGDGRLVVFAVYPTQAPDVLEAGSTGFITLLLSG